MSNTTAQFLPFNAINEFMLTEFRQEVILHVFSHAEALSGSSRGKLNALVKQLVQVPGFRNSAQAPAGLKARNAVIPFEKFAIFTAKVLQCWSELHPELAVLVHQILTNKGWEVLPVDADRTLLPGFIPEWPEGETYDTLDAMVAQHFGDAQPDNNSIRLMAVWLSGRLPLNDSNEE